MNDEKKINENQNQTNENKDKSKERKPIWLVVLLLLLFLALCVFIGFFLGKACCEEGGINIVNPGGDDIPDLDPSAGDYVPPEPLAPAQGVAIPGWGKITIPANQNKDIVVDFYNPKENEGLYYLTFELRLPNDSELGYEVLYKSGLIKPGLHIQKVDLSRGLDAGTYSAIIHVQPYRMSDNSLTNNADLKTELIVK